MPPKPANSSSSSSGTSKKCAHCQKAMEGFGVRCATCVAAKTAGEAVIRAAEVDLTPAKEKSKEKKTEADSKKSNANKASTQKLSAAESATLKTEQPNAKSAKRKADRTEDDDEDANVEEVAASAAAAASPKKKKQKTEKSVAQDAKKNVCSVDVKLRFPDKLPKEMKCEDSEKEHAREVLHYELYCVVPNIGQNSLQYCQKMTKMKPAAFKSSSQELKDQWTDKFNAASSAATLKVFQWIDNCKQAGYSMDQIEDMIKAKWKASPPKYIKNCDYLTTVEWPAPARAKKASAAAAAPAARKPVTAAGIQKCLPELTGTEKDHFLVFDLRDPKIRQKMMSVFYDVYSSPEISKDDDKETIASKKRMHADCRKRINADCKDEKVFQLLSSAHAHFKAEEEDVDDEMTVAEVAANGRANHASAAAAAASSSTAAAAAADDDDTEETDEEEAAAKEDGDDDGDGDEEEDTNDE